MHIKREILLKLSSEEFRQLNPSLAAKYVDFTIPVSALNYQNHFFRLLDFNFPLFLGRGGRMDWLIPWWGHSEANENWKWGEAKRSRCSEESNPRQSPCRTTGLGESTSRRKYVQSLKLRFMLVHSPKLVSFITEQQASGEPDQSMRSKIGRFFYGEKGANPWMQPSLQCR